MPRPETSVIHAEHHLRVLIRDALESGNPMLPSLRQLARRLEVSQRTVLKAVDRLRRAGLIVSVARRGYAATDPGRAAPARPGQHALPADITPPHSPPPVAQSGAGPETRYSQGAISTRYQPSLRQGAARDVRNRTPSPATCSAVSVRRGTGDTSWQTLRSERRHACPAVSHARICRLQQQPTPLFDPDSSFARAVA
jgi:DNA-binding transcriptional MocR family regulator